ncbi:hypothetical protein F4811DRAFT_22386 [Daldinia bambusicola]|nr:hypothetical protein F4811DRAFT_22386 [Daldinia bambusicola]
MIGVLYGLPYMQPPKLVCLLGCLQGGSSSSISYQNLNSHGFPAEYGILFVFPICAPVWIYVFFFSSEFRVVRCCYYLVGMFLVVPASVANSTAVGEGEKTYVYFLLLSSSNLLSSKVTRRGIITYIRKDKQANRRTYRAWT